MPASELADAGTEAANQEAFHDVFVGVAMQASPNGVAQPIRVATSGVFEFECLPATAEVGDLIGVDEEGSGTELTTQMVAKVATANLAVGRWAKLRQPGGDSTAGGGDCEHGDGRRAAGDGLEAKGEGGRRKEEGGSVSF